ncbi:MAG TPA: ABC transporter ATP-binding protein [Lachnospiraceae bacterium]|nr:ABC transporter ATP-binding protein [Lachnospiraceae bacterium]
MLKRLYKVAPFLILALTVSAATSILDGIVTKNMMGLLDYAMKGDLDTLGQKAPWLLLTSLALVPLGILEVMTNYLYRRKTNMNLKTYYITKVFDKKISEFQKENTAKYLSAMTNDFNTLELNLVAGIHTVCMHFVIFLVGIWLLSTVDKRMILLAVVIIAINLIITLVTSRPTKKAYKERSDLFETYTAYIKEVLSAFHIVKNYNLQDRVTEDYYEKSEEIQHKGFLIERMMSFIFASQNFTMSLSIYGIICGVGYMALKGNITPGGMLLVVQGIERMNWPIFEISENLPKLFTSGNIIKKIEDSLKNSDTYEETVPLLEFKDKIEFRDVAFHYDDDDRLILTDINLEFKKNGKYLIVGPSGGGKSTLLKLFRKYFNPTKGDILIDGHSMKDVKREDYFHKIANIEQQVFLFEDTVRNNITLYKEYSEEEIQQAIQMSGLSDFVENLPEGLDTIIYDNGRNISGGERSRIVIARALLSKASILFMDEAFASLDMERAKEIEKTILGFKDITVINVSHVIFKDTKDQYDRVITIKKTAF